MRNNNRTIEKSASRKTRLTERAVSFHAAEQTSAMAPTAADSRLRRPKTLPDLRRNLTAGSVVCDVRPMKLTKLLLNVTVQGSVGAVQVLASPESSVGDLISAVVRQYNKEGRRPVIAADCSRFDLHYSQFSLESLERAEKLQELGSRNFFLCAGRKKDVSGSGGGGNISTASSSCSAEVEKETKRSGFSWLKFIDLRL
ncbi:Uncharacterized protein At4g22758 [Linum perenne]